jgi:Tfp pilus assembly protein FimT
MAKEWANKNRYNPLKDRYDEPERGSEWEQIKILLEGDGNSNKMNTASNTRLQLTTHVGQAHVATGPGNQHTTFRPENAAEHQTSSLQTNTGQTGEHHRSDRSLLVKLGNFH